MARIDLRMPANIARGFRCGPEFKTPIVTGANGFEYRNRNWLYGRFRAMGTYSAFGEDEQETLDSIFQAAAGMWAAFRFRDLSFPWRHEVEDESLSPETGTNTPLQVVRSYTWGALTTQRIIQALDQNDFVLKKDGVEFTAYTLDDELGLITPDDDWAAGTYTWSGKHDLWMRFNSDWLAAEMTTDDLSTADIELIEDRQR